ncbi:MAG: hypothetical protein ACLP7I_18065, partial [Limisphaerales bacterium]
RCQLKSPSWGSVGVSVVGTWLRASLFLAMSTVKIVGTKTLPRRDNQRLEKLINLSMGSSSRPQTDGQTLAKEASIEVISGILPGLRRRKFDKMPGLAFTKKSTSSNTM